MILIIKKVLFVFFLISLFCPESHAWTGRVTAVTDGDTIKVLRGNKTIKVRLYGIDAPESKQPYGREATQFTKQMVLDKVVDVEDIDRDRYGRTVAIVRLDGRCLNEELIVAGLAWFYSKYCKLPAFCACIAVNENIAHKNHAGLWQDTTQFSPWVWRHEHKRNFPRLSANPYYSFTVLA